MVNDADYKEKERVNKREVGRTTNGLLLKYYPGRQNLKQFRCVLTMRTVVS
jgi:hypothetical protein